MRFEEAKKLTLRMPETLERLIRDEALAKGLPMNQLMILMLNQSFRGIFPCADS